MIYLKKSGIRRRYSLTKTRRPDTETTRKTSSKMQKRYYQCQSVGQIGLQRETIPPSDHTFHFWIRQTFQQGHVFRTYGDVSFDSNIYGFPQNPSNQAFCWHYHLNEELFNGEFTVFSNQYRNANPQLKTMLEVINFIEPHKVVYTELYKTYQTYHIACTENERSFSCMKRVTTWVISQWRCIF